MVRNYQRKPKRIPKLQLHKRSGRGVVRLDGKDFYCGEYGTKACEKEYNRLIAEYLAGNPLSVDRSGCSILELLADYLDFSKNYYRDDEGKVTRSYDRCVETAKILNELYGDTLVEEFTAARFKAFKQKLIETGKASTSINHLLGQARRIFKWGAAEGLASEQVFRNISLVPNVRRGRNEAPEPEPIEPVADDVVEETLAVLPQILADMVCIQLLTGMRPGEVCRLRPCDLDQTGTPWIYSPHKHKTRWRGKNRLVPVGPKAREILGPYLDRPVESYCFSPRERMEQLRAVLRSARKSKVPPSQASRAKRRPQRLPGEFYSTSSYDKAILSVIRKENKRREQLGVALIPEWSPNQLRHSAGTTIRAKADLDTARTVLGHGAISVTEIYAEMDLSKAKAYAEENG